MTLNDGPLTGAPIGLPAQGGGVERRAIFPTYDFTAGLPALNYLIDEGGGDQVATVKGSNLADITSLQFTSVLPGAPGGSAPTIASMTVSDTQIDLILDADGTSSGDAWGLAFQDAAGSFYIAPSPIRIVGGG